MLQDKMLTLLEIEPEVQKLLSIYCAETINEHDINAWFSSITFDDLRPEVSCLATATTAKNGFSEVPQALLPRLRGLQKYIHTLNAGVISGLLSLSKALECQNISMLLTQETGLYAEDPYVPQRQLWHTRIGLLPEDMEKATTIAERLGYSVERTPLAAVLKKGVMHNYVFIAMPKEHWIWDGAVSTRGQTLLRPRYGAMLISQCQSGFRMLLSQSPKLGIVGWMMDMHLLMQKMDTHEWACAAKIATIDHATTQIALMLSIYDQLAGRNSSTCPCEQFKAYNTAQLQKILLAFKKLPSSGHRLRRLYLRCRLARPDSISATIKLMILAAKRHLEYQF